MKNLTINRFFYMMLVLFGLMSCSDREVVTVDTSDAPILANLSTDRLFLDKNFPNNPALTVSWTKATYTVPVEVKYNIEASLTEDFKDFYALGTTAESTNRIAFTVEQMNKAARSLGIEPKIEGKIYIRVISSLGTNNGSPQTSNTTSLLVTPYELTFPDFYLVGEASYVGWDASKAQLLYKKSNMSYIYTYLESGKSFRFLGQKDWSPVNYSINADGIKADYKYFKQVPSTIAADGEENMKFSGATGIYKVAIDATNGVQSLAITASAVKGFDFPEIYLVGNIAGNGWNEANAVAMTKVQAGVFEFTTTLAADSEFKILGQKSWGELDWGNIIEDGNTGFLGPKGDNGNIKFVGDGSTYKITVNLKAGIYTFVKQ